MAWGITLRAKRLTVEAIGKQWIGLDRRDGRGKSIIHKKDLPWLYGRLPKPVLPLFVGN